MTPLRWMIDAPADGPANMARDEALLLLVGLGASPPTLRFYRWSPPTISLGYFQDYRAYEELPAPAGELPVVRRQTGGGAILHDLELTYSLTLPLGHPWLEGAGSIGLYERVHAALAAVLVERGVPAQRVGGDAPMGCSHGGPFFCFERHSRFDLLAGGRKLVGSAQRRTPSAVLQHGSLILKRRFEQQVCAAVSDFADIDVASCLTAIARLIAGGPVGGPETMRPDELQRAEELRAKYADPAWTRRR
jgi:lipoate-protein ligase A